MTAFQYYGIDWLAMTFTFLAIWQIGNKNRIGFVLMMTGNSCWIAMGFLTDSLAMIIANIIFFLMNLRAVIKWSAAEDESLENTA
ncbi:hypothetical protein [Endozoicomonas arenosclerae]|uniref:hypothetical protein n=1 Tax=Endozoicomonas arenosclerae TaxID=1633495 RepID=UPI000783564B|nr:hypothetical protein [Endozoicomonas arenosclerae]